MGSPSRFVGRNALSQPAQTLTKERIVIDAGDNYCGTEVAQDNGCDGRRRDVRGQHRDGVFCPKGGAGSHAARVRARQSSAAVVVSSVSRFRIGESEPWACEERASSQAARAVPSTWLKREFFHRGSLQLRVPAGLSLASGALQVGLSAAVIVQRRKAGILLRPRDN